MIGVQDEQDLERAGEPRVGVILPLAHLEEHREEVLGVAQLVVRIDVRLALRVPERPRAERRHLGDHPDDLLVADLGVVDVPGFGVERGQRSDAGQQHAHRVRVVAEALHQALHVLVDVGVEGDLVHPLLVLLLGRQLAVNEQVRDLEVRRGLRELLDGVAAVLEDPGFSIDVRDCRAAGRGVGESGIVKSQAGLLPEIAGRDSAVGDGELVFGAVAVVTDGQGCGCGVSHAIHRSSRRSRWSSGVVLPTRLRRF